MAYKLKEIVKASVQKRMQGKSWELIVHELTSKMDSEERRKFAEEFDQYIEQCKEELKAAGSILQ